MSHKPTVARALVMLVVVGLALLLTVQAGAQSDTPALCNDWNFVQDSLIQAEFGEYRYEAYCKFINPRQTGIWLTDVDVTMMVNVFFPGRHATYPNGGIICLRGNNELLFTTGPDATVQRLEMFRVPSWPRHICATVYESGYVLRTRNGSGVPALRPPPEPVAQSQCMVTTRNRLRLRAESNTTSDILGVLPAAVSLSSDQRIKIENLWWFHVLASPANDEAGWLSGDYLTFEGDCGYVCEQDSSGTRIICRVE